MALIFMIPFIIMEFLLDVFNEIALYSLGIIPTIIFTDSIKEKLTYYATEKNRTNPSALKKAVYTGIIISLLSFPLYIFRWGRVFGSSDLFEQIEWITTAMTTIAITFDIFVKIKLYYYAIKAFKVANSTVIITIPQALPEKPPKKTTITNTTKVCPTCNAQLINGAVFCHRCGNRISPQQ